MTLICTSNFLAVRRSSTKFLTKEERVEVHQRSPIYKLAQIFELKRVGGAHEDHQFTPPKLLLGITIFYGFQPKVMIGLQRQKNQR